MEKVLSDGLMGLHIGVTSLIITSMGLVHISGLMEESTLVTGEITRCMEEECSNGQTAEGTKAHTLMIKKKVKEYLNGLMGGSI